MLSISPLEVKLEVGQSIIIESTSVVHRSTNDKGNRIDVTTTIKVVNKDGTVSSVIGAVKRTLNLNPVEDESNEALMRMYENAGNNNTDVDPKKSTGLGIKLIRGN